MMLHPILQPVLQPVLRSPFDRRPTALTISQLLPSGAGRVAAIYSDPAKPSYDECIQKNMDAIAAGRPQDCVLFADAAGQTPVVYPIGAGQGKGLLLDRSAGLVRGPELVAATNLSTFTASETDVSKTDTSFTAGSGKGVTKPITVGKWYEGEVSGSTTSNEFSVNTCNLATSPTSRTIIRLGFGRFVFFAAMPFLYLRNNSAGTTSDVSISLKELPGHHQQQPTAAARGEFSRRYNELTATDTLATQSITAIATQYRLYFTGAGTVTLSGAATGAYSAGSHTITCTDGSLTLTVAGEVLTADLRFEADATIGLPEYQRVTTASDYDEVGFPTYHRAVTDDWAKSHMNPNGATKAYVFWAGQKMSDAAVGMLVETSSDGAATNGTVRLSGPPVVGQTFGFGSRGTLDAFQQSGAYGSPLRAAVIANGDIVGDLNNLTVNGTTTASATDQGTGTYTEQDVFFASRAGTSLFANIREYAPPTILFLQTADSLSASHLVKLQRGYAKAVGVTL